MQGAEQPSRAPLTLFAFNNPKAIKDCALGCDADVGGTSTVHLDFDDHPARLPPSPSSRPRTTTKAADPDHDAERRSDDAAGKRGAARFHGHMRLAVRPGYEQRVRGGYAGFRNKVRTLSPSTHG